MTRSLDQALLQGADFSAMQGHSLLINGFHNVSQENGANAVAAANGKYITDQWQALLTGTWAGNWQQVASPFASQPDIPNGLKLTISTAQATLAAGDMVGIRQPIEGTNLARLAYGAANAKPVTIAFLARASVATTGYFSLSQPNAANTAVLRSFLQKFTLPANTDTFVTFTIPGDVAGALVTTNVASLLAMFCFGCGTTFQGAVGSWTAGELRAGADVTNLAATAGNNVILSGAVMFAGAVPISQAMLPLLARRYDDDLRLCQRYFQLHVSALVSTSYATGGAFYLDFSLPAQMRGAPSVNYINTAYSNASSLAVNQSEPSHVKTQASIVATGAGYAVFDMSLSARM